MDTNRRPDRFNTGVLCDRDRCEQLHVEFVLRQFSCRCSADKHDEYINHHKPDNGDIDNYFLFNYNINYYSDHHINYYSDHHIDDYFNHDVNYCYNYDIDE